MPPADAENDVASAHQLAREVLCVGNIRPLVTTNRASSEVEGIFFYKVPSVARRNLEQEVILPDGGAPVRNIFLRAAQHCELAFFRRDDR
jgi:hypothetical protein